jgi:hypothetical protein
LWGLRSVGDLFWPLVSFEAITLGEMNACLLAWEHKMGPLQRPDFGFSRFHGLRHNGELVAVVAADQMIAPETCGLRRHEALELTRLCACRPSLCRVALRLWREFVFPSLSDSWGKPWAISYQDRNLHDGDTYRFDGWVPIGTTRSGTDKRAAGGEPRRGRNKRVWAWHPDPLTRAEKKAA